MLAITPYFTHREYRWTEWKAIQAVKGFNHQFEQLPDKYTIWGYDGPEAHVCIIYRGDVPYTVIDAGYSQAQNDADKLDFETNFKSIGNKAIDLQQFPFAAKSFGSKKIYKRVVGIKSAVQTGTNDITYTVQFPWVKITGIELVGGELGDTASFYILDSATGMISTIPNHPLNQFAFDANVSKDFYEHKSEFDADLYGGLQIKVGYYSISSKNIGINFILNELK
jgi:hypothetical protein